MIFNLNEVQRKLNYTFKNPEIARKAFTHASYANGQFFKKNNERYEFLGDSVLGFVVTDYLFRKHLTDDEGDMTLDKQAIVSCKPLSQACRRLNLHENLLIGDKVTVTENLQENLMESVIGAIYLDGGLEEAKKFIIRNLIQPLKHLIESNNVDYKSQLNELSSKRKFQVEYKVVDKSGADNLPTYTIALLIDGNEIAVASAEGKKQYAEQIVAQKAIAILTKN